MGIYRFTHLCKKYGTHTQGEITFTAYIHGFYQRKPPTFKELIVPSVQSTNALTMNLKTKKISEYFFWKLQIFLVELYNQYWPWNKNGEDVEYKIREKERKSLDAPLSKPEKKRRKSL